MYAPAKSFPVMVVGLGVTADVMFDCVLFFCVDGNVTCVVVAFDRSIVGVVEPPLEDERFVEEVVVTGCGFIFGALTYWGAML